MSTFFQFRYKVTTFFSKMQIISVIFMHFSLFSSNCKLHIVLGALHTTVAALKYFPVHQECIVSYFMTKPEKG